MSAAAFPNVHSTVMNLRLLRVLEILYARRLTLRDLQRRLESRFVMRFYDAACESHDARAPRASTVELFSAFMSSLYLAEEPPQSTYILASSSTRLALNWTGKTSYTPRSTDPAEPIHQKLIINNAPLGK